VLEAGLSVLPARSPYALLISDVLAWSKQYPNDWEKVWKLIDDKWNRREPCPDGALAPFNIDAKLNGAYIALGLLYGRGDFTETIEISTRAGQDSDCNPSNAAGILGVMHGYTAIPDHWKSGIPAIADKKFAYTNFNFRTIVESTEKRALALVQKTGGKVEGETVRVKLQKPRPAKLEVWDDYGSPAERVAVTDARWTFHGPWESSKDQRHKVSAQKGAEASIRFTGTGVIVVGEYLPDGGKADVYLDGELAATVDVYPDEKNRKGGESVWHAFKLPNREHQLRLVVRGEPYEESEGPKISLSSLVVFR
jgi:hypothetical protein